MEREVRSWQVVTADGTHLVEYYPPTGFKAGKLLVDGENIPLATKPGYVGVDMPILSGGGHDIRFVSSGKKNADISYDGVYLDSGNIYEPQQKMPTANWISLIASGLAFILGGAIPALCAVGGVALGSFVAANKNIDRTKKVVLGVLIAILTWVLAFGLSMLAGKGIKAASKNLDKTFGKDPYSVKLTQDFNSDSDTDSLADNGYDVVFAAYSEDVYAFATSISEKQFKLLYGANVSEEEYLSGFYNVKDVEVTESGVKYCQSSNDTYTYIISVCKAAGSYYETQMFCLNEDAEKLIPKMIGWTNSIKVADDISNTE